MDDILLADSDMDILGKNVSESKDNLALWVNTNYSWKKVKREDSINYLGYKTGLQKIQLQNVQIKRGQLSTQWFSKIAGRY